MLPKLILNEIALHICPIIIMWLWKNNKTFGDIFSTDYFWQLKLGKDYPQFPLKIDDRYFESYKRLYVGKAEKFSFYSSDTNGLENNLIEFTKYVKDELNCVRGDIIDIENNHIYDCSFGYSRTFIFDGENIRHRYLGPRYDIGVMNEFPITYWGVDYAIYFPTL